MLVLVGPSLAQAGPLLQFADLGKHHLPREASSTLAVAAGDVDGDGDVDLVIGNLGQDRLLLNDGTGVFVDATLGRLPLRNAPTNALALCDVDGDVDLDLVVVGARTAPFAQQARLLLNNGTGAFTDAVVGQMPEQRAPTSSLAFGDVDGDGDVDLVVGVSGQIGLPGESRLFVNTGSGFFRDETRQRWRHSGSATCVGLVDVDGDADLDLMVGNAGQQDRLYLNDGTGTFADVTASCMPPVVDWTTSLAFGDIDGDGDSDVVLGTSGQSRLYLNSGTGTFTNATATGLPMVSEATVGLAMLDLDGDADLDLILGTSGGQNRAYLNNGAGVFVNSTSAWMPAVEDDTRAIAAADFDGDGDADMVFGNVGQDRMLLRTSAGFVDATGSGWPVRRETLAVVAGDLDRDGDVDVVTAAFGLCRLYLNTGVGTFVDASAGNMPVNLGSTSCLALGDVDGDLDLDLILGNESYQQNRLYLNNGAATFTDVTAAQMPAANDSTRSLALGDVDRDGDLDLVVGNFWQQRLYRNDGTGTFTDVTSSCMPVDQFNTRAVALGDVDGDGDLDLVVGNDLLDTDRLYLNNGAGVFAAATAGRLPLMIDATRAVAFYDVDGDGDLDLLSGNWGQNRLYCNDGFGTFLDVTAAQMPTALDGTRSIAVGDIDGDGDPDLLVGNDGGLFGGEQNRLLVNNGAGTFSDITASALPSQADGTWAMALCDIDGDFDLDLLVGNRSDNGGQDMLLCNLHRQISTPLLLRTGHPFLVEARVRNTPVASSDLALLFLSTTRVAIPVPSVGTVGITPDASLGLAAIPRATGVATFVWNVPNAPTFAGVQVFAQAAMVTAAGTHLSNVTGDVLVH